MGAALPRVNFILMYRVDDGEHCHQQAALFESH